MKTATFALVALLALVAPVAAQTIDPCAAPVTTTDTIYTGRAPRITWQMAAQVPISSTDPTLVTQRIDGFYVTIDAGTKTDIGKPTPVTCANGLLGFTYTAPSGFQKGSHTATIVGWNFVLDPVTQAPTTTRQEGQPAARPFVVVDPLQGGPPQPATNVRVHQQ